MTADASSANANLRGGGDETFRKALGDFARRIGERTAAELAPDPVTAAEKRNAALSAYDRDRMRHWMIGSSIVLGTVALLGLLGLGMMWLPLTLGRAGVPVADQRGAQQSTGEIREANAGDARREIVVAGPIQPAKTRTQQPVAIAVPAVPESPDVSMAELKAWAEPTPGGLSAAEIREIQGRLLTLGFNPGRIDGAAGPNTKSAARIYRERRGFMPANGAIDYNLLTALRQDPGPRVAQRPPRSNDPFEPIVRWWKSL